MTETDDPDSSAKAPTGPMPRWEERYPGRLQYELDALRTAGIALEIDEPALASGRLILTFNWPLDGATTLRLQAVFPDAYPHFRPQVFLLAGLDPPPSRHRSPIEGNLCLLGRDTRQWMPSWSLCKLLEKQLADAVRGTGDEDPQGEPAEYWWNTLNLTGSFCLIDSAWDLAGDAQGTLLVRYVQDQKIKEQTATGTKYVPVIRAYVEEVRASDGRILHHWDGALPLDLKRSDLTLEVPWVRTGETIYPDPALGEQVNALRNAHPWLKRSRPHRFGEGLQFELIALTYPSELAYRQTSLGWTFVLTFGHLQAFKPTGKKRGAKPLTITALPVYRAGPGDIGWRVPTVELLKSKRVLVVGTGAVGAPVAIELARNGCRALDLVEHDIVEPGNTIRWPLGAPAWGQRKADALHGFLAHHYPATEVRIFPHLVGIAAQAITQPGDDDILDTLVKDADLVIDGSAAHGVTTLLDDRCRRVGVPLISLSATPTLEGGSVVLHRGGGGCPNCLEHAWHKNEIKPPPGRDAGDETLIQPAGCGERTFTGAAFDLQELSLQAVRLAVNTLSGIGGVGSVVQTLSFVADDGTRCPPCWRIDPLPKHPDCWGQH